MPGDSTRKPRRRKAAKKPKKPYPEFPLLPHPSGKWQKKIRGRIHYFGRWAKRVNGKLVRVEGDGWEKALEAYKAVADDLHAGRTPRVQSDGLTVADLCNRFLTAQLRKVESGELRRIRDALAGKQVPTGRANEETGEAETVKLEPNPTLRAMILRRRASAKPRAGRSSVAHNWEAGPSWRTRLRPRGPERPGERMKS